jgi:hypothetical protein
MPLLFWPGLRVSTHLPKGRRFYHKILGGVNPQPPKTPQTVGFLVRQNFIIKFWGLSSGPENSRPGLRVFPGGR